MHTYVKIKRQWKSTLREGRTGTRQTKSSHHLYFLCLSSPSACLELFTIYMDKPFGWRFGHANGKQNSVVVNFVPESRRVFHCTNQFHLPKSGRESLKLVSKAALKKRNMIGKTEKPFQALRCPWTFSTEIS